MTIAALSPPLATFVPIVSAMPAAEVQRCMRRAVRARAAIFPRQHRHVCPAAGRVVSPASLGLSWAARLPPM